MRSCGLVMALTLGLVLMMSRDGESVSVSVSAPDLTLSNPLSIPPSSSPSSPLPPDYASGYAPPTTTPSPQTYSAPSPLIPTYTPPPSESSFSPAPSPQPYSAPSPTTPYYPPSMEHSTTTPPYPPSMEHSTTPPPPYMEQYSTPPTTTASSAPALKVGFYKEQCKNKTLDVEALITSQVQQHFRKNATLLPALLRMQFHDCFVHGCDASILIEGNSTEKTASPNLSVRGYEFIEELKIIVEEQCPGVVSCADIIAIATKVLIKEGGGPDYPVETGRRDGLVSQAQDVDLPNPFITVPDAIVAFAAKNLTVEEMVVLLGAHTVGITHCANFETRLYPGNPQFDPLMNPKLRAQLQTICPKDTMSNNFVLLNQSPENNNTVDNTFYDQLVKNRGVLSIDQALARHPSTSGIVIKLAENVTLFDVKLASAMVKLQAVGVLTGNEGQIRNVCGKLN